jgi:hypothetical protein
MAKNLRFSFLKRNSTVENLFRIITINTVFFLVAALRCPFNQKSAQSYIKQ